MSRTSYLKYCQLAYLSGPACERTLYRQMAKRKPTRILEIGLGLGVRTLRMFDIARRYCDSREIVYTGIDAFESRTDGALTLSMKSAYKLVRQNNVKVKLVPGEALAAMTVTANSLANTDLIVIDSDIRDCELLQAWKYFPRMMHAQTLMFRQTSGESGKVFQRLTASDIQRRSDQAIEEVSKAA